MAFRIRAHDNMSQIEAYKAFEDAVKLLKKSKLAREIISDLEAHSKIITVLIGPGLEDKYRHPTQPTDSPFVGTIEWDPTFSLGVIDKAKKRPQQSWVPNKLEKKTLWNCCGARAPVDEYGEINPAVCLMHEMGHVLQYLSNPDEFRGLFKFPDGRVNHLGKMDLEEINTAAVEQPIILELKAAGVNLGVRWGYYHTA